MPPIASLGNRQKAVLSLIRENNRVLTSDFQNLYGWTHSEALSVLVSLRRRGLVERDPRTGWWS